MIGGVYPGQMYPGGAFSFVPSPPITTIMPSYATIKIEFSPDPLSDVTPSWVDVSRYCLAVDWFGGKQRDLDDPQAGGANITFRNDQRRFEPEYVAGAYYPNIVPLRRFRLTMTADGVDYPEGIYYATSWDVTYPAGTAYSEVTVTCVDGIGILSLSSVVALDPPDATTISEVIEFDQPFAYYRMNDLDGSTLIARKKRKRHHHHHHRHNRRTPVTLASEGSGADGVYKGKPNYGEPGLVVGDADTSVQFQDALGAYAQIPLADVGQFADTNAFTLECLFMPNSELSGVGQALMLGPWISGPALHSFYLSAIVTGTYIATLNFLDGTNQVVNSVVVPTPGRVDHVAVTWDGGTINLYVNGVVDATNTANSGKKIRTGTVNDFLYIGGSSHVAHMAAGWLDEAAFYERALPAARIKAHADAALNRGYPQQVEGDRVAAVVNSDLWVESKIDNGQFQITPVMKTGQLKFDEVTRTVHAAQPWALFFFDGVGDPIYLGWDYLTTGTRSTPVAIFGDTGGEVPYTDLTLTYDDDMYNNVTISGDTGVGEIALDATSQAAYRTRAFTDTGLLLTRDADAANVAGTIRDGWAQPMFRCDAITLNGANQMARTQILTRQIGDLIRVRRRGTGGTPIDIVTRILGKSKSFDPDGNLTCTWSLARGFNATDGQWHEGITGFSELGQTTVLA